MSEFPSPALPRRLAALIYDTCLVLPLVMFGTAVAMGVHMGIDGESSTRVDAQVLDANLVQVLTLLTTAAFYCGFWLLKGQTLGMQAWRIRLRSFRGESVTPRQAVLRCLGAVVSLLPAGAGYWWCLFDRNNRYWHDYLSGTELELLPKRRD
ncbi:MAG: RDD family protein [Gammaproteobacteria bacterium]|nr:RDD family protein [Gammaproteobacteria bacterium]